MITKYELYQPKAPKLFEVVCGDGLRRVVRWTGKLWAELKAEAEVSHGGLKRTAEENNSEGSLMPESKPYHVAKAKSLVPVAVSSGAGHSLSSQAVKRLGGQKRSTGAKARLDAPSVDPEPTASSTVGQSGATDCEGSGSPAQFISAEPGGARHDASGGDAGSGGLDDAAVKLRRARDKELGDESSLKAGAEGLEAAPAKSNPFQPVRRARSRPQEPSRDWRGVALPKAEYALPFELSFAQARAHAALDEARAEKGSSHEALERYHAAIAAVDRIDPGFYLGRFRPMKPLARSARVDVAALLVRTPDDEPVLSEAA